MTNTEYAETCKNAADSLKCKDCKGPCAIAYSKYGCITMRLRELAKKLETEAK